ncbi:MAG TPA: hypothetical protein VJN67_04405 [Stellaceae bacterium]|nr:hypothetical protein [Stellaceae bacterium]
MHAPGSGILIDDRGEPWSDNSPDLARRLGYRDPDFDAPAYAVRNLGFIHVRLHEEGVRVSLRSGRYSLLTLTAALYALIDRRPRRIVLAVFGGEDWSYEMFTNLGSFAERAEDLAGGEPIAGRPRWLAAEKKLDALDRPAFRQARLVVEFWKSNRGRLSDELYDVLRATDLLERAVLVRKLPRSTRLVYQHFGGGIKMMRPCETFSMIGRDAHDVPDGEYGAWVADHYAEALQRRRLRLDGMRAVVGTSLSATLRVRYDRLLVPWRRGADQYVLGLSMRRELSTVA